MASPVAPHHHLNFLNNPLQSTATLARCKAIMAALPLSSTAHLLQIMAPDFMDLHKLDHTSNNP